LLVFASCHLKSSSRHLSRISYRSSSNANDFAACFSC
jgi:hypothetical protein